MKRINLKMRLVMRILVVIAVGFLFANLDRRLIISAQSSEESPPTHNVVIAGLWPTSDNLRMYDLQHITPTKECGDSACEVEFEYHCDDLSCPECSCLPECEERCASRGQYVSYCTSFFCFCSSTNVCGGEPVWIETNIGSPVEDSIAWGLEVADADNDGKNEVIAGHYGNVENDLRAYEYELGEWIEENIAEVPGRIRDLAVGDADNDGENEIVVGLTATPYQLRMYEFNAGSWIEIPIWDEPVDVGSVTIGDADNDGQNEIVIGLKNTTYELRMYKYISGTWTEVFIWDTPEAIITVAIGDADNDSQNEVVMGMNDTTYELRIYKYISGTWTETNLADIEPPNPLATRTKVNSVAIGDADNDAENEIVIGVGDSGLGNDGWNLRMYDYISGAWIETNIALESMQVSSVKIGDADNDGKNEIVRAMEGTGSQPIVKMYEYESGSWVGSVIKRIQGQDAWSVAIGGFNIRDSDSDGMSDDYETTHSCLDPMVNDADLDFDGDSIVGGDIAISLTNIEEMDIGTDPCNADSDADGFNDGVELYVGTDPLDACPDVISSMCGPEPIHPCCPGPDCDGDDTWPPDFNVDRSVGITDVLLFKPVISKPEVYDKRYDLDADGDIDVIDVLSMKPYIMTSCE